MSSKPPALKARIKSSGSLEPSSKLNRAFSAGGLGFCRTLGRCPRFATANPSCGGLKIDMAPLALDAAARVQKCERLAGG
jgi:hypothetical protein